MFNLLHICNEFCVDVTVLRLLTATVSTSRRVKITWNLSLACRIVTVYIISYTTNVSYASGGNVTVNGNSTNGTLTNLEENTLYTITVHAIANNTLSCYSCEVQTITYTDGKCCIILYVCMRGNHIIITV